MSEIKIKHGSIYVGPMISRDFLQFGPCNSERSSRGRGPTKNGRAKSGILTGRRAAARQQYVERLVARSFIACVTIVLLLLLSWSKRS